MTHPLLARCALALMAISAQAVSAGPSPLGLQLSPQLQFHASEPPPESAPRPALNLRPAAQVSQSIVRELVLIKGEAMLGANYALGASQDDAVDCSALVQQMFRTAGIELPRTTRQLVATGKPLKSSDKLQPGDLLFYRWERRGGLHVAVYMDEGRILHASPAQREVVVTTLNQAWDRRLVTARRLL